MTAVMNIGISFPLSDLLMVGLRCLGNGCGLRPSCDLYCSTADPAKHNVIDHCDEDFRPGYSRKKYK